jgi:hypothetical protein
MTWAVQYGEKITKESNKNTKNWRVVIFSTSEESC